MTDFGKNCREGMGRATVPILQGRKLQLREVR